MSSLLITFLFLILYLIFKVCDRYVFEKSYIVDKRSKIYEDNFKRLDGFYNLSPKFEYLH